MGLQHSWEKIDMLDFADLIAINKFDKRGSLDALRDVKKQYQRNHQLFTQDVDEMPVFGTIASQFNDPGANSLYKALMDKVVQKTGANLKSTFELPKMSEKILSFHPKGFVICQKFRINNRAYDKWSEAQKNVAQDLYAIHKSMLTITHSSLSDKDRLLKGLQEAYTQRLVDLDPKNKQLIEGWDGLREAYKAPEYTFKVRDKELVIKKRIQSHCLTQIYPKFACLNTKLGEMCYSGNYKKKCTWKISLHSRFVSFQKRGRRSYPNVCR